MRRSIGRSSTVAPEWCDEIRDDGVVIAGIERDVVTPGVDDGPEHIQRLIPVERRDLYGDHSGYLREPAPECVRKRPPAD